MRVSFSLREREEVVKEGIVRRGREDVESVTSPLKEGEEEEGNRTSGGTWATEG